MKQKVINILPHPPAYELHHNEPRYKIHWEIPDGGWVGIKGDDWPNLIGNDVLKLTNEFEYEVWQPDLNADKVYDYKFSNDLKHVLFPANERKTYYGYKLKRQISSDIMLESLEDLQSSNLILHMNSLAYYINQKIIKKYSQIPKVIQFHSIVSTPNIEMRKFRKNFLANAKYFKLNADLMRNKKIYFVYNNSKNKNTLTEYCPLGFERIFMGCDFDYWCPNNKIDAKKTLEINVDTKVFSMASRFNSLKQIDKVIEIFTLIDKNNNYDFKLIIAGHGGRKYENYLRKISSKLLKKGKLMFPGYLDNEEMRALYQATDIFISASTSEGGPTSVVKAIACGIPVMCTKVGGVDEFLLEEKAGIVTGNSDYNEWKAIIEGILEERIDLKEANREKAKKIFHGPITAKKWINIYRTLEKIQRT